MNDESQPPDPVPEGVLRALRMAARQEQSGAREPSPEALEACLLGHATPEQREEVIAALESSPSFRSQFLDLSREIEGVQARTAAPEPAAVDVPTRSQFLRRYEKQGTTSRPPVRIWAIAALVIAVAVGAVWLLRPAELTRVTPEPLAWNLSQRGLDAAFILRDVPRGSEADHTEQPPQSSKEAALAAFSLVLRFESEGIVVDTSALDEDYCSEAESARARPLVLRGQALGDRTVRLPLPSATPRHAAQVDVWFLAMPSRDLYRLQLSADTAYAGWPSLRDSIAVVVASVRVGSSFQAECPRALIR